MTPFIPTALLGFILLQAPATSTLRIVVLEGEDGVNVIQQKTAVRPLVEVRDRNNLPVGGVTVTFTIGGPQATFAGGVQTLTVATNAAGQAAATGLNAVSSGAFQIQVQAAYQGQVATAAVSQTNFATAAAAQAAGASSGATSGTGGTASGTSGGAAGGGGGISTTTIGIVGAAVGGGALIATRAGGGGESGGGKSGEPDRSFSGQFSAAVVVTTTARVSGTCVSNRAMTGSLTIRLVGSNASADITVSAPEVSNSSPNACLTGFAPRWTANVQIPGGRSNLSFSKPLPWDLGSTVIEPTVDFTGSVSGDTINGTVTYKETWSGVFSLNPTNTISGGGTATVAVTLR